MSPQNALRSRHLALWSGRAGLVNTLACIALALPLAFMLLWFAERTNAEPTCRLYGEPRQLVFHGVKHYSRDESTTVCLFTQADGQASEVPFQKLAPFLTDLWVSFALDLKFTIGAFAVLLAFLRTLTPLGSTGSSADA